MALSIVKVGGSLARYPAKLRELLNCLIEFSAEHSLVIIPGGGEFADTVRKLDKRFGLSDAAAHQMAILAMDQYGLLLADLLPEGLCVVRSIDEAEQAVSSSKLPIFLPFELMRAEDPLINSWDVTSDSIALCLASRFHAGKVLFVTDVDGIFADDPKRIGDAKLLCKVSAAELMGWEKRTSVDKALPQLLNQWPIDCYVVNGLFPSRIKAILNGKKALSTHITAQKP